MKRPNLIIYLLLCLSFNSFSQVSVKPDVSLGIIKPTNTLNESDKPGSNLRAFALIQNNSKISISAGIGYQYFRRQEDDITLIRSNGWEFMLKPAYRFNPESKFCIITDLIIGYNLYNSFIQYENELNSEKHQILDGKGFSFEPGLKVLFDKKIYFRFSYALSKLYLDQKYHFPDPQFGDPAIPTKREMDTNYQRLIFSIGLEI